LAAFAHAAKSGGGPTGGGDERTPRIAVYLDYSNSMVPYLDAVEAEVRTQFPDADVSGGKFKLIDWLRPDGPPKPAN